MALIGVQPSPERNRRREGPALTLLTFRPELILTSPRQCRNPLNGVQESNERDNGHNSANCYQISPIRIRYIMEYLSACQFPI